MPDLIKIVLTGPESSGKTTLAKSLADYFHCLWVPEYARTYLTERCGQYEESDLTEIALGQVNLEDEYIKDARERFLIFDTNLLTIEIWAEYKYGRVDPVISEHFSRQNYDIYFLCAPDMDWEPDPLRENPDNRWELFDLYEKKLKTVRGGYYILRGTNKERVNMAGYYFWKEFGDSI